MDAALRILIVSREPVVQLGLEALVEREGLTVAGSVVSSTEVVDAAATARPSIIVIARFTETTPIAEQIHFLRTAAPTIPVLVIGIDDPEEVTASIRAGASGWISGAATTSMIVAALRAAATGLVVGTRSSMHALAQSAVAAPMPRRSLAAGRAPAIGPRSIPAQATAVRALSERVADESA